ncbi:MAG: hypothetical protein NTX36_07360 [Proteobacteria bacterium]|nr:hypothetical protein [Pseudomonadota bacterium]
MHFVFIFNRAKHPDKNYDVDEVMSELVVYERRPGDQLGEIRATVAQIAEIAGKTVRTLYNGLSLLKLSDEIQAAIRAENLPVSQGYLFAANLDCPDLRNSL